MALFFDATTEQVDCGSGSSLDALTNQTVIMWVKTNSTVAQRLWTKGYVAADGVFHLSEWQPTNWSVEYQRDGLDQIVRAAKANFAAYDVDKWLYVVSVTDDTTAGNNKLYMGDLALLAAEPSSYVTQNTGDGAFDAQEPNATFKIGNRGGGAVNFSGDIAFIGVWNRGLTQGEIWEQQFHPHVTAGCVLFMHLGYAGGVSTQPDWSGNGNNGTVTGATQSAHVPLTPLIFGDDDFQGATTAATLIKTINGLAIASVKTIDGLAIASVKTLEGLTN